MTAVVENETKIIDFDALRTRINNAAIPYRIVQCHGVFDLLHVGHIRHFQSARKHGNLLVVTVTPDRFVNKGPNRPHFPERLRAEAIAALDCVDYVVINAFPTAVEAINSIRPHVYAKGSEYRDANDDVTGKIQDEVKAVNAYGGDIVFTDDIAFSSSALLNQYFSSLSEDATSYLAKFKTEYNIESLLKYFQQASETSVLVVGEAIIDIYHFSEVIGKAGKEPILVAKHNSQEVYLGGVLAVAQHLSEFCKRVTCLTYLGENAEYEDLIRSNLRANIDFIPLYKKDSPTIVKRRYLDGYLQQKLLEIYDINDDFIEGEQEQAFLAKLTQLLPSHDLSITVDYGHGLIGEAAVDKLITHANFLAVNTQSNASNFGFNCISKYTKADYISIASRELQLNYRQKHLSIKEQLNRLINEFDYKCVMITTGKKGAYVCNKGGSISEVPAFASSVVDRVGAGDAVLAITSLFAYLQAPSELIAFVGNVVGAEAVNIMGNKESIQKVPLLKHVMHLLK